MSEPNNEMPSPGEDEMIAGLLAASGAAWDELRLACEAATSADGDMTRLLMALYEVNAVVPFDWMEWGGLEQFQLTSDVAGLSNADVVRLVTAATRADRFDEGSFDVRVRSGLVPALVGRLLEIQPST